MYDYVIVTHLPAFYKVNLYNELSKKLKIFVIYLGKTTAESRSKDFVKLQDVLFEYKILYDGNFQDRNKWDNVILIGQILSQLSYKRIIVGGWDLLESWFIAFFYDQAKNCLALESTILESTISGFKGVLKKIFLKRIAMVFASGKLHQELLNCLHFKGKIKITKGVGIINKPYFLNQCMTYKKNFLFIGRLSSEKNINFLLETFNRLTECSLTIIGVGPLKETLKSNANSNISFIGTVNNTELKEYFVNNNFLILPSISEPWGLVVEEALYFRIPVIVSKNCGSSELVQHGINGFIIDLNDEYGLINIITSIDDDKYQLLKLGVEKFSIKDKDEQQILSYIF